MCIGHVSAPDTDGGSSRRRRTLVCSRCQVTRNTHRFIHGEGSAFAALYAKLEKTFKRVLAYRDKWPDGGSDKALANVTKSIDKFQQCREMLLAQR